MPILKTLLFILLLMPIFVVNKSETFAQIATSNDWVGIFSCSSVGNCQPDPAMVGGVATKPATFDWKYTNCTRNLGGAIVNTGDCPMTIPSAPGTYEIRMYANNTNVRMGTATFYVIGNPTGTTNCNAGTNATGLISSGQNVVGNFGNYLAQCITNSQALFLSLKIPTYDELKTVFYTQIKSDPPSCTVGCKLKQALTAGNKTQTDIPFNDATRDHVYLVNGDLTISGNPVGNRSGVVFVEGNLRFTADYTYGTGSTGTVFVVKGDISIDASVRTINAVLISEKIICTSTPGTGMVNLDGNCSGALVASGTNNLTVNGNLISLSQTLTNPIRFRRTLTDNTQPSEKVNQQAKYFVILRYLFSQPLQITTEIN